MAAQATQNPLPPSSAKIEDKWIPNPRLQKGRNVKAKSHMVPSNSWKVFSRKGSEAEKGQWASSQWPKAARRAHESEHMTAGL